MYQIVKTMRQAATPVKVDALLRVDYDLVLLDTAEAKALAKDGKINAEELRSRLTDALARISAVAESASTRLGPETDLALMSRFERAAIRGDLQQFDEALDDARDTVPAMEELLGPRNWRTLEARSKFGSWLVRRTRAAEARTWLERAYAGYVAVNGAEDDSAITTGIWLGRALHDAGDTPAALVRLRSVIDAAEKAGADRAALGGRAERIADLCKEWGEAAEADTWRDRAARWKQTAKPAGP